MFCGFCTGLSGCWRRSAGAITATAILMLLTCLLAAGAMGLWHTVEFFEKEKVVGEEFYQQWNNVLRDNTRVSYDWSYVLAWAGVASSLIAAILLSGAAVCLRSEREKEEQLNLQYLMPGTYIRRFFFHQKRLFFTPDFMAFNRVSTFFLGKMDSINLLTIEISQINLTVSLIFLYNFKRIINISLKLS